MRDKRFPVAYVFAASAMLIVAAATGQVQPGTRGLVPVREAHPAHVKSYAFLIGISRYQKVQSLEYADKDAELLADFLKSPLGGVDPENIFTLTNEEATRAAIDDAVRKFVVPHGAPENSLIF